MSLPGVIDDVPKYQILCSESVSVEMRGILMPGHYKDVISKSNL